MNETLDYLRGKIAEAEASCVRDCHRMQRDDRSTQDAIDRRWADFHRSVAHLRQMIERIIASTPMPPAPIVYSSVFRAGAEMSEDESKT